MRGDVHRYRPERVRGREQQGARYAIVVLASRYRHLSTWLVVPTSTRAHPYAFRPPVEILGTTTLALCDATVSVDPANRLGELVGYLSYAETALIDETLGALLDLDFGGGSIDSLPGP